MGRKPASSKKLTMTAVITDHPEELEYIAGKYPKNTRLPPEERAEALNELKYHSSDDKVRRSVLSDVMATDPKIKAVVADKSAKQVSGKKLYRDTADVLLYDVMSDKDVRADPGGVAVIFDEHNSLKAGSTKEAVNKAAERHGVKLAEPGRTAASIEMPALQAADFPAGAVGAKYNPNPETGINNPDDFRKIRSKTKVRHVKSKR
jgi:hypothetical protein